MLLQKYKVLFKVTNSVNVILGGRFNYREKLGNCRIWKWRWGLWHGKKALGFYIRICLGVLRTLVLYINSR